MEQLGNIIRKKEKTSVGISQAYELTERTR